MSKFKWTEENTNTLTSQFPAGQVAEASTVEEVAEMLGTSVRSVSAKLRRLGYEVASTAKSRQPSFSQEESQALQSFVESNPGRFTYAEIAQNFMDGEFTAKEVQGKLLSMQLTPLVKKAEKVVAEKSFNDKEEADVIRLAQAGKFIEEIADYVKREIAEVRGKALSLLRSGAINALPKQKVTKARTTEDPLTQLEGEIADLTVAEIAKKLEKTERGVKAMLTRRGITCADYDGEAKRNKADSKTDEE